MGDFITALAHYCNTIEIIGQAILHDRIVSQSGGGKRWSSDNLWFAVICQNTRREACRKKSAGEFVTPKI
jgi:hypothetical protein